MPDVAAIHVALATAYEALGQTELAEIHRQQVQPDAVEHSIAMT